MRVQHLLFVAAFGVTLASSPAGAQTIVSVGTGHAHDCFSYAKAGTDPFDGVSVCDIALKQDALTTQDRAATYDNRGVLLDQLGRGEKAASDFQTAISLNEKLGDAHVNLGSVLIKQRRYPDALVEINKGLDLGMSFPYVGYYDRAIAEELTGQFKESYFDFKKVLELVPDYGPATERLKDFTVITTPAKNAS